MTKWLFAKIIAALGQPECTPSEYFKFHILAKNAQRCQSGIIQLLLFLSGRSIGAKKNTRKNALCGPYSLTND